MEWCCIFFLGRFVHVRTHTRTDTHTRTHLCPQPISDMRNCTFICIRIIDTSNQPSNQRGFFFLFFFSICAGTEHCHTGEYEREGKREHGWEGTRHKRLTLSFPHFRAENLMCLFIGKYNLIYSKTDFQRGIRNDFYSKSRDPMTAWWGKMFFF